jgi:glycolate oxidase FAD binding subunit
MTVAVHAGTPLRALAEELAPHGQHVAFDAARVGAGATVGGLFATADSGPGALTHGSLRDLVIGVTMVLADGTVARSGGHVIKNVAGYDLAKVLHGSYGTLGVLAVVVLRLHPAPKASGTVAVDCSLAEAAGLAATVLAGPFEPAALEWISGAGAAEGTLLIRLDGTQDALPDRIDRLRGALEAPDAGAPSAGSAGGTTSTAPPALRERAVGAIGSPESAVRAVAEAGDGIGSEDADPWARHAELTRGPAEGAVLRIGVRPSRLVDVLNALPATAVTAGLGTGIATVTLDPDAVADAHATVHAAGGTSTLRARPAGSDAPAWGPPPSALGLLTALKAELDPDGRFGPGRFTPWMA